MRRLSGLLLLSFCGWAAAESRDARDQSSKPALPFPAARDDSGSRKSQDRVMRSEESERRASASVSKSLDYLARIQAVSLDGSFPSSGAQHAVPVPVAALGALAYMAAGSTPERGPHGEQLSRAIDYLVSRCDLAAGSPTLGYVSSPGDKHSRMHGHGFATLALAQAYAMSPQTARGARLREALAAAVHCIESSQGPEGGWYYDPRSSYEHENSVTVCLVQALRGAHGAGIHVDPAVIQRAVDYVKRCQTKDGSFQYALNRDSTSPALTAAGIATLNSIGIYEDPVIRRALESLTRDLAAREQETAIGGSRHLHYERFYIAQALWQAPDARLWEDWRPKMIAQLESEQSSDGSWHDAEYGDAYATAMHSLVLSIPLGLLPIFQR